MVGQELLAGELDRIHVVPKQSGPLGSRRDTLFPLITVGMERFPLYAQGPQDVYSTETFWDPVYKQHTRFAISHRSIPFIGASFVGKTVTLELKPNTMGDLVSNMFLRVTLPSGPTYCQNPGRAILKRVDFKINEQVIETLTDDWYQLRDQIFLDADEQDNIASLVTGSELFVPLDFFFCRRFSSRRSRPTYFFPMCALTAQTIYIVFTFSESTWFSNSASVEFVRPPELLVEEITLSDNERTQFMTNRLEMVIPKIKQESVLTYDSRSVTVPLTASFPVQTLFWFFRRKEYETSNSQYANRYEYGYKDESIFGLPLAGTKFIDAIDRATLYLNGTNILGTFQGGNYYRFYQPMNRGLTVPIKDIYTYSFGIEHGQGFIDFSRLDSAKTTLNIDFDDRYSSQITKNFNMYVYYYGWTQLVFQSGSASLSYVG